MDLPQIHQSVFIAIIVFGILLFLIVTLGMYIICKITEEKSLNRHLLLYAILVLSVGCVPMMVHGGALLSLELVKAPTFEAACRADNRTLETVVKAPFGSFAVRLAK